MKARKKERKKEREIFTVSIMCKKWCQRKINLNPKHKVIQNSKHSLMMIALKIQCTEKEPDDFVDI